MATRSIIGVEDPQGQVIFIYCHCDGYPEYNGAMLKKHYDTQEKALELVSLGDMFSLGSETGCPQPYSERGIKITPKICDSVNCFSEAFRLGQIDYGQEYIYLFTKGQWHLLGKELVAL
jgi:hypothetical protein